MKLVRGFTYTLSTLVIYLGFSLVGWGLDNLAAFFGLLPRLGYAGVICVFAAAVGVQAFYAPEGISGGRDDPAKRIKRQTWIGGGMTTLMLAMLVFLPWADRREIAVFPEIACLRWVGLVLAAAGYTLIFWSGVALGKMYSAEVTVQKEHHLVASGLYRFVRHPRYLGLLLTGAGVVCLFRSWAGFAGLLVLTCLLAVRIRDEEELMAREFGAEWQAYCARSWRLVPYVF